MEKAQWIQAFNKNLKGYVYNKELEESEKRFREKFDYYQVTEIKNLLRRWKHRGDEEAKFILDHLVKVDHPYLAPLVEEQERKDNEVAEDLKMIRDTIPEEALRQGDMAAAYEEQMEHGNR